MMLSLNADTAALAINAYGASWTCSHIAWDATLGVLIVPVPADATVTVGDLSAPADLDAVDRPRLRAQLLAGIAGVDAPTRARVVQASIHECFRTARSVVYVASLVNVTPQLADSGTGSDGLGVAVA